LVQIAEHQQWSVAQTAAHFVKLGLKAVDNGFIDPDLPPLPASMAVQA
jgi:hypothetical protein